MQVYCSKNHANPDTSRFCTSCGEALPLPKGQVVENRYEITHNLGHGGFGRTYLAVDRNNLRKNCVLKEFAPQVTSQNLQKAKELFDRESSVLRKINHPQIPCCHDAFQTRINQRDLFFLVQDYVEGNNYFELLKKGKSFTEEEIINLLHHVLPILDYIHSLKIIHRDISPDNLILRTSDNLPVLIDFGGVKQLPANQGFWQAKLGSNVTLLGKAGYAPDEQLKDGKVSANSDLYALGVTVLVVLTGKDPQKLYNSFHASWLWGKEINVSPPLEKVLRKMLAYHPKDRYQNAKAVIKDLPRSTFQVNNFHSSKTGGNNLMNHASNSNTNTSTSSSTNPFITGIRTVVVAPVAKANSRTKLFVYKMPVPEWFKPCLYSLIITSVVSLVGVGAWKTGTFIVDGIRDLTPPTRENTSGNGNIKGGNNSTSKNSQRTIEQVFDRLTELEISNVVFTNTVNEIFYSQRPELNGRELTNKQEDAALITEWKSIADNLLSKLEQANLSQSARKKIGNYSKQDADNWDRLAKQGKLGKYESFSDLRLDTYKKFTPLFPGQERGKLNQATFLQIWYAMADDLANKGSN
ncbi:serine/threonine protein kinase [Anabaena sp. FACHB-1237]|uniref:serine/threonine-protein kinase n=1 Tax=Anabaena sp. FACHB-1237 TaxID=2692769 RepID=UPI00167FFDDC|nr:serine/threonine-protein kinase [Anabaena sp. FACHB-1237]MBD2139265.1 serine/threonine protein kinase [Anabaena sp. FACHB-1237]